MTHKFNKFLTKTITCLILSSLIVVNVFATTHSKHAGYLPYFQAQKQQKTTYRRQGRSDNLWVTLTKSFSLPHYENTPAVKAQIQWFMAHPQTIEKMAEQAQPYLYYVLHEVKKRKMPGELALLPMIESAYDPFAYSYAGAAGLWQLMPGTATGFGLHRDYWYDGRKDVELSTKAALTYLEYLEGFFHGNWNLAIASYNSGEGTVLNAIKRNKRRHLSTKFWSLYLPKQTEDYVPRLLALATIISEPKKYPVNLPYIPDKPYFAEVKVKKRTALSSIAKKAHMKLDDVYQLNPGYRRWATDSDKRSPHRVLLPIKNVAIYKGSSSSPNKSANIKQYKVKSGDTLGSISTQFDTDVDSLKSMNRLDSTLIKANQIIIVPGKAKRPTPAAEKVMQKNLSAGGDTKKSPRYIVKHGDSLWSIAQQFNTTVPELRSWNHLKHTGLKPGDTLLVSASIITKTTRKRHYRVRSGDTLSHIAHRHNIPLNSLLKVNELSEQTMIKPGQLLIIPG